MSLKSFCQLSLEFHVICCAMSYVCNSVNYVNYVVFTANDLVEERSAFILYIQIHSVLNLF